MDVHRSRFVPYPSSAVTAVAFSRSNNDGLRPGLPQPALKLALGRANGQIEIWNPQGGKWCQETVFPGGQKSIDGLAWTREPDEKDADGQVVLGQHRLFSIASSPDVTEWDLERGEPKRRSTGNFSEVWCFAAQPRQNQETKEPSPQDIVAGCGDGAVVLLTTADNDLQFKRFVARVGGKKAQCMSIAYQTPTRVVAGFGDSSIRVFDTRNGSVVRSMSVGVGIPGAPKNAIVWQVKCLPNGDIVSGDSNGEIVFWDGRSYSLAQRIKGHDSECLDLVTSADGKTIMSGSLDGRVAVYHRSTNVAGRVAWAKSHHRRMHDGEVKCMSAFDSDGLSVVVSGGPDLVPAVTPLREYGKEKTRKLPELPQQPALVSARHARLLASWYENTVSVWRIARRSAVDSSKEPPRKLVAKIVLSTQSNIRSVSISDDGRVLAASTDAEIKAFQLRRRPEADALVVRKLDLPGAMASSGGRLIKFSPDGKWLSLVTLDNEVQMVRIVPSASKPKQVQVLDKVVELERQNRPYESQSAFRQYGQTINRLAFATDSSVLVASDLSGHLDSWVLEGHEDPTAPPIDVTKDDSKQGSSDDSSDDSDDDDELCVFYGQHWADNPAGHLLPKLDSMPIVLSFRPVPDFDQRNVAVNGNPGVHSTRHNPHAHSHELPKGQHRLWIMTARHQMYEFEILSGKLSEWSRANPTSVLPQDFKNLNDRVMGAVWDVTAKRQRLWLYGCSWMFMLDVGGNLSGQSPGKKRSANTPGRDAKRQKTSGAGSKMISSHREGLPESIKRYEDGAWTDMSLDGAPKSDDELDQDEVDEEDDARLRLTRMRSVDQDQQVVKGDDSHPTAQRPWWCSFKYRHILGMVPLEDDASVDEERLLEVAIVERPPWDALKTKT